MAARFTTGLLEVGFKLRIMGFRLRIMDSGIRTSGHRLLASGFGGQKALALTSSTITQG
jgi:hypothetical protein